MSLLNNGGAGGGAGGTGNGADGADDAAAKVAGAGGEGGESGAGDAGGQDNFDINSLGDELKNPDIYKDGKFFGKYTKLGEVGNAIKELTGKMRNAPKAPDNYDFSKVKVEGHDDAKVDLEDPIAKAMLPVFKKHGISQDVADELASTYLGAFLGGQVNAEAELKALGKDGPAMIDNINEMMKGMSKEDQEDILAVTTSAAGVRALHKALSGRVEPVIPPRLPGSEGKSATQLKDEAFAYKEKHAKTIEGDVAQQDHYDALMKAWAAADEDEKKSKR